LMNLEGKNRTTCDGMIRLTNATFETLGNYMNNVFRLDFVSITRC